MSLKYHEGYKKITSAEMKWLYSDHDVLTGGSRCQNNFHEPKNVVTHQS